jgi:hypothetical protein
MSYEDTVDFLLKSTPAKKLASSRHVQEVHSGQPAIEILRNLEASVSILVRGHLSETIDGSQTNAATSETTDALFSRLSWFQNVKSTKSLSEPFSSTENQARPILSVHPNDPLDVVISKMIDSGSEIVGVVDQGVVSGVITCTSIIAFIRNEVLPSDGADEKQQHDPIAIEDDDDDDDDEMQLEKKPRPAEDYHYTESQLEAQRFTNSWCCELLVALCLLLDMGIAIFDFATSNDRDGVNDRAMVATGCLLSIFVYESSIRFYGFRQEVPSRPWWILDFSIVAVSTLVYAVVLSNALPNEAKNSTTLMRGMRIVRLLLIARRLQLAKRIRRTISSQKSRYRRDGFDLDLTYITPNCIAMSLPAVGAEAAYRNPVGMPCSDDHHMW